jgi:hypothetical protein
VVWENEGGVNESMLGELVGSDWAIASCWEGGAVAFISVEGR